MPSAVLNSVGKRVRPIGAATYEVIIDLEGLRPDPVLRSLRRGLEEALLLLCATPRHRYFLTGWAERDHEGHPPQVLFVFESLDNEKAFLDVADTVEGGHHHVQRKDPCETGHPV